MSDTLIPVPDEWRKRALITSAKYDEMYARSVKDPEGFWGTKPNGWTGSGHSPR